MKYVMTLFVVVFSAFMLTLCVANSTQEDMNCNAWLESNVKQSDVAQVGMDGPILVVELKDSSAIILIPDTPEIQLTEEGKAKLKKLGTCTVEGNNVNVFKAPPQRTSKDELDSKGKVMNEKT